MSLSQMPKPPLINILLNLGIRDIKNLMLTNKSFREMFLNEYYWRLKYARDLPNISQKEYSFKSYRSDLLESYQLLYNGYIIKKGVTRLMNDPESENLFYVTINGDIGYFKYKSRGELEEDKITSNGIDVASDGYVIIYMDDRHRLKNHYDDCEINMEHILEKDERIAKIGSSNVKGLLFFITNKNKLYLLTIKNFVDCDYEYDFIFVDGGVEKACFNNSLVYIKNKEAYQCMLKNTISSNGSITTTILKEIIASNVRDIAFCNNIYIIVFENETVFMMSGVDIQEVINVTRVEVNTLDNNIVGYYEDEIFKIGHTHSLCVHGNRFFYPDLNQFLMLNGDNIRIKFNKYNIDVVAIDKYYKFELRHC